MNALRVPILSLFAVLMPVVGASANDELFIVAEDSSVSIEPRQTTRRLLTLPALEFSLAANPECTGEPASMTLSIADEYATFDAEQLRDESPIVTTLRIASQQIALVAPADFCLAGEPEGRTELYVPDVSTVHGSLRCVDAENRSTMTYTSVPLPLRISCRIAEESDETRAQDPSTAR